MSEPDIQIQRDYPQTLVNSQWVKWAAERIAELEQQLAELREAVDMAILKHRIRREKGVLVWFEMPSEEMEKLAALRKQGEE